MKSIFALLAFLMPSIAAAQTPPIIINVIDYGAACGSGDCTAAFQAAFNAVPALGGEILIPPNPNDPEGCWHLTTQPRVGRSNVNLHGQGRQTCVKGSIGAFGFAGNVTTIQFPPSRSDVSFLVYSPVGAVVGGYVMLVGAMPGSPSWGQAFVMSRVEKVDGNAITISHPFPLNMAGAPAIQVEFLAPLEGLQIHDIRFKGVGFSSLTVVANALDLYYVALSRVWNVWGDGYNGAVVNAVYGMDVTIESIWSDTSGGVVPRTDIVPGFDSVISAVSAFYHTGLTMRGIKATRSNGFGIQAAACSYCAIDDLISAHAEILAPGNYYAGRGIKFNGVVLSNISNLRSMNSASTGIGIVNGSFLNGFSNVVTLRNKNFSSGTPDGNGIWSDCLADSNNTAVNITSLDNQLYDIVLSGAGSIGGCPGDNSNTFRGIQWNNQMGISGTSGNTIQP